MRRRRRGSCRPSSRREVCPKKRRCLQECLPRGTRSWRGGPRWRRNTARENHEAGERRHHRPEKGDAIIPKVPGQQVGFTEASPTSWACIGGTTGESRKVEVTRVGSCLTAPSWFLSPASRRTHAEARPPPLEGGRQGEGGRGQIIQKAAAKKAKEKKKRMKANDGVDPDEVKPTRAQVIREEQEHRGSTRSTTITSTTTTVGKSSTVTRTVTVPTTTAQRQRRQHRRHLPPQQPRRAARVPAVRQGRQGRGRAPRPRVQAAGRRDQADAEAHGVQDEHEDVHGLQGRSPNRPIDYWTGERRAATLASGTPSGIRTSATHARTMGC